jgi:hypothetical protein
VPILAFPDYRPDISSYKGSSSQLISNVLPRGDGYGPFPDLLAFTLALPAPCRGYFYGRKGDGSVIVFAGTATKLYQLNNTTFGWIDVSLGAGTYSALSSDANWQFAQFGDLIFATQQNVVLQQFAMSSSAAFANTAGSPPQAAYVNVVGQFLVLSGLLSARYRIQWSGLGDTTNWTAGLNQSDFQDFPDGGIVRGAAGGEFGVIFQDSAIRTMIYAPGSPVVFQIVRIADDLGLLAPYGIIRSAENIYFPSTKGFMVIKSGGLPAPIGKERVDRTHYANLDRANLQLFIGAADPASTRIFWAYKSLQGSTALFDTILVYDYGLDKFTTVSVFGQYIASLAKPGITLEGLDAIAPGVIAITGAANNGSGLIRLTVASSAGWTTGDVKAISGVGGTTEANGNWTITVINSTHIDLQGSAFVNAYTSGGIVGGSLDAITQSLDDFAAASLAAISGVDENNKMGFFNGANLEAKLHTAEQGGELNRMRVSGFRPDSDAPIIYGAVGARENIQNAVNFSAEVPVNAQGVIPARVSTRYARAQVRIPAGTAWTFATGVEPMVGNEGRR